MAETSRKAEVNYDAEKQVLILRAWKACLGRDTIYLFNVILSVPARGTHFFKLLFKNDIFSVHQVLKKKKRGNGGTSEHFFSGVSAFLLIFSRLCFSTSLPTSEYRQSYAFLCFAYLFSCLLF